jgi:hypothetical protein
LQLPLLIRWIAADRAGGAALAPRWLAPGAPDACAMRTAARGAAVELRGIAASSAAITAIVARLACIARERRSPHLSLQQRHRGPAAAQRCG